MALWTDIIDPAELTGYARASLEDYEAARGNLARWLPNQTVADVVVRFVAGSTGLVEAAKFRSYDAEIEIGNRPNVKRVTLELPALGQNVPVSEYEQLRARGGQVTDEQALVAIQNTTDRVVRSVSDAMEYLRGVVLTTGVATIDQDNFQAADNFGRSASHNIISGFDWTDPDADPLADIQGWTDLMEDDNGEEVGCLVMSRRVFRAFQTSPRFQTNLVGGGTRPATDAEIRGYVSGAGLPEIEVYNRRVQRQGASVKALPDDRVFLLPAPVAPNDAAGTDLGGTFWGRTLSSTEPGWGIEAADQPGIVAGVWRNDKPPMGIEVIADAIGMPVLANANLSLAAKVL